jgi:hypothetical protein
MGVRRQIYLGEIDDLLLEEESRRTGLSVSELIREAVRQCYGMGRKLTWDDVLSHPVEANSAAEDAWVYDPLFDRDIETVHDEGDAR